ncbi:DUF2267 domain-containing protein [Streptomyces sp. NPDC050842]|uniref:DUF2267 domain-containing protein n=1 Tax=Streptomyces sp. NPDC050842 TaxID=3365636 RepID=UPI00378E8141
MNANVEVLLDQVQERGGYEARQEAAGGYRACWRYLGHIWWAMTARISPACCPGSVARCSPMSGPRVAPLTPSGFVEAVASRDDIDVTQARRAVTAVLATVAEVADDWLLRRILTQLPPGHAGLFGCTDPA